MAKAYLKVSVVPGKEKIISGAMAGIKGVKQAYMTAGEQDIIALVEADNFKDLLNLVLTKLRVIEGITKTDTNLILE